jgi:hypothetical protein
MDDSIDTEDKTVQPLQHPPAPAAGAGHLQVVSNDLPDPPYPADTRSGAWQFDLDMPRIEQSDTWVLAPRDVRPWLLLLWARAWQQAPVGSMPADDALIAARLDMDARTFTANREFLLRGWRLYSDGRLYHPVIVDLAQRMLAQRRHGRERIARWREAKLGEAKAATEPAGRALQPPETPMFSEVTRYQCVSNAATGHDMTGQDKTRLSIPTTEGIETFATPADAGLADGDVGMGNPAQDAAGAQPQQRIPPCPTQGIVDLWNEHCPTLPRVEVVNDARKRAIAARWREVIVEHRNDPHPRQATVAWFEWFLRERVAGSPFLSGNATDFRATFDWVMKPTNFARIAEGIYEKRR